MSDGDTSQVREDMRREISLRDRDAQTYDEWYISSKGRWWHETELKVLLATLNPDKHDIVLDVGCGTGRVSMVIAPMVKKLHGIDFSPNSIEILAKRAAEANLSNVETTVGDMTEFASPPPNTYTKAITVQVLQHIPSRKLRIKSLREILHVLKPGGRLVCTVYRWGGSISEKENEKKEGYWKNGLYRYAFSEEEAYDMMREAGYVDIDVMRIINAVKLRHLGRWTSVIDKWLSLSHIKIGRGMYLCIIGHKPK